MESRPFAREEVKLVPDEFVTGTVLSRLHSEFKRTNTWPYGFDDLLGDWKGGRIRLAGVFETEAVFDHARENHDWHMKTFAKPGAPWSIFFCVTAVSADGHPEVGWISPAVDRICARWIRSVLDPSGMAPWSGAAMDA